MAAVAKQVGGRALSYLSVPRGRPPAFHGSGHMFDIPSNVGRVYLLLSYAPGAGYPYFRLRGVAEDGGAAGPA